MRHAAGQLADGFDLLGLAERLLDPGALVHFKAQLLVGVLQRTGALDHQLFELLGRLLARLEQGADLVLTPAGSHRRLNGACQRHRLNRPFKQRDVAEKRDDTAAPGDDGRLLAMTGEDDEREVGPWRLVRDPLRQRRRVLPEQAFLGEENHAHAGRHLADELRETPTIDGWKVRAAEKFGGSRPVAANRSKYQNLLIAVCAHPADPSGIALPVYCGLPEKMPLNSRSGGPSLMPALPRRNSRMVCSCWPLRFLTTDNARRTVPANLEIAQHDHRIAQIADVEWRIHRADQPMLSKDQDRQNALLPEIGQEFVHLQDEKSLVRHRAQIAVQAVDDDDAGVVDFDALPHICGEFARRQLGWVNLLKPDMSGSDILFERQAECLGARLDGAATFVEREEGGVLATLGRRCCIGQRNG